MKINHLANVFRLPGGVGSKRNEGEGGSGRNAYDPNQTRKESQDSQSQDQSQDQGKQKQFEEQKLNDALDAFRADASTQANGLTAQVEGAGPGLKILVKDVNGTLLRQFSREEFLRLREGVSKDSRSRGKILDQKL